MADRAKVTVNGQWIDAERFFLHVPEDLVRDTRQLLRQHANVARQAMLQNVSGGVLKRQSGSLAQTIKAMVRLRNGTQVSMRAGSRYFVGRFWEEGFDHRTKKGKVTHMAPRPWSKPVVDALSRRVADDVEAVIDKAIQRGGF